MKKVFIILTSMPFEQTIKKSYCSKDHMKFTTPSNIATTRNIATHNNLKYINLLFNIFRPLWILMSLLLLLCGTNIITVLLENVL